MNKQEMAKLLDTVQKELEEVKVALAEMLANNRELNNHRTDRAKLLMS